jgi:hypothetical protein
MLYPVAILLRLFFVAFLNEWGEFVVPENSLLSENETLSNGKSLNLNNEISIRFIRNNNSA